MTIGRKQAIFFRDELREARANVQRDAEDYDNFLFALERLGSFLTGQTGSLGSYKPQLGDLANRSPLAETIPAIWSGIHSPFVSLYEIVKQGRNDALHQGAVARNLTSRLILLSIVLEDALMSDANLIRDFMVANPICAMMWQPLSLIRQQMLANSYSYLPVERHAGEWWVISDAEVAKFLRTAPGDRNVLLATPLEKALDRIKLLKPEIVSGDDPAFTRFSDVPKLVCHQATKELIGIVTAFDLL